MPARDTANYWLLRFAIGLACLGAAATGLVARLFGPGGGGFNFLCGALGFWLAYSSITPLVRFATLRQHMRTAWQEAAKEAFARASLPRRIYYLLAAVAEIDGPMSAAERETVRQFLLERFVAPVEASELRHWELQPLAVDDREGLAARIAGSLAAAEVDSLFCWCCLVAFADGKYRETEHTALQEIARGLGLPAGRARMLFHLARAQYLGGQRRGGPARPVPAVDARAEALQTLGLPADATPEQVRRRHRELVRKFHPDAQPNLGPVAQQEATERFRSIQRAYEVLNA
ncbi:MAG: TerB family tellurite resistance protein [Planctomycetes bacterium]|nr:TerB family tellurite resistance protein [Planctomycetota bacterium]